MKIGRAYLQFLRFFSVALILAVALTAKIPNKFCKCNHKNKPVKQTCPYGELRQVVNCLLEADCKGFELFLIDKLTEKSSVLYSFSGRISFSDYYGRAPPVF